MCRPSCGPCPAHSSPGCYVSPVDQELARVGASLSRRLFSGFPPRIGRYRIAGRIGAGGMGQVYRGHDPTLGRPVAIKVLGEARAASANVIEHEALLGEARAMASISHPNVIEVYEVGVDARRVFIAMELVDGATLGHWVSDEKPGWVEIVRAYVQAGEGLHAAHAAGIVHRDFKPSNALIGRDGRVRVLDFGLATEAADADAEPIAGTPAYMAPEVLRGEPATPRSDQFSFCVSVWQALFGGRPFAAVTVTGMRRAAEGQRLVRPDGTSVPKSVIDGLIRGLHPDPEQRWPSLEALLDVLRKPVKPRGPFRALAFITGWVGWKVAAGAILVALFPAFGDANPCEELHSRLKSDWSDQRRASIASAFADQGRAERWSAFDDVVDARIRGLADAYANVCEGRRIDEETVVLDTELACLRRRYVSLERMLAAVPEADAAQLVRIEDAVHHAASQSACSDGPSQVLPPRMVAALAEADAQLAEVEVLRTADRYDEASALLRELSAQAQQLRYEPLQARVASTRADVEIVRGDMAVAEDALATAYQLALALSDHQLALSAATRLTALVGVELSRPVEAMEWARHAEVAAERAGFTEPPVRLWRVLANVHFNAGQHARAAELFEKVAASMADDESLGPRERIEELRKIATVHLHLERTDEARKAFATALELAETEYGPHSHNVAALAFNLGVTTLDPVEKVALYERAATTYADLFDDHPDLGDALYRWGQSLAVVGRPKVAEEKMREGIAMLARGIGEGHPYVLDCRTSLVSLLLDGGRFDEASDLAVSVHADAQAKLGDDHPVTAGARELVGAALDGLGDAEAAREAYEDAARMSRESPEPDIRMVLRTTASLAEFRARNGEPEQGRAELEQAAVQAGDAVGTEHPLWADLQLRALALKPETESAPEDLERARAALDVLGQGAQAPGYASAMFSVARLEHAHGDRDAARARAEALAARLRQSPRDATLAAEVDRWLASAR